MGTNNDVQFSVPFIDEFPMVRDEDNKGPRLLQADWSSKFFISSHFIFDLAIHGPFTKAMT